MADGTLDDGERQQIARVLHGQLELDEADVGAMIDKAVADQQDRAVLRTSCLHCGGGVARVHPAGSVICEPFPLGDMPTGSIRAVVASVLPPPASPAGRYAAGCSCLYPSSLPPAALTSVSTRRSGQALAAQKAVPTADTVAVVMRLVRGGHVVQWDGRICVDAGAPF